VGPYSGVQIVAATVAGALLLAIASGQAGFSAVESGFASNGYGDRSPGGYGLVAALVTEIVLTAVFLYIILGATDDRAPKGFAPIAIGLGLTVIHLVGIPVTNLSVNPARSLGVAWFAGGPALVQVWLFLVAPVIGAAIAGVSYAAITRSSEKVQEGIAQNPDSCAATALFAPATAGADDEARKMGGSAMAAGFVKRDEGAGTVEEHTSGAIRTVPKEGLEPSRPKAQEPKSCVSTSSTTPAGMLRRSLAGRL
jgi:hypothetical protein